MKLLQLIENNGLYEKWATGDYMLALQVEPDQPYDAVVCPGHGISDSRIMFKAVDLDKEISDEELTYIHMIPKTIWASMTTDNTLNKDVP